MEAGDDGWAAGNGLQRTITILGIDEADSGKNQVSWISPIARTLLKARAGDVLRLVTPAGVENIEVINVHYPDNGTKNGTKNGTESVPPATR